MVKTIKIMADYGCFPLWDVYNIRNVDPEKLPLLESTRLRLKKWSDLFENTINHEDYLSSGFPSEKEENDFEKEGLELWKLLAEELFEFYEILFFSYKNKKLFNSIQDYFKG